MATSARHLGVNRGRPTRPDHSSAVVWINRHEAVVAATLPEGRVAVHEFQAEGQATRTDYLDTVADAIGDRERVVIQGPGSLRTSLEREYVSLFGRSDRLIDVEPAREPARARVADRLRELAG